MSKTSNRNMVRKRRQGNMTSQKANHNLTEDLMECQRDESPVAVLKRMMIRKFSKLEEGLKKTCKIIQ
jgi:hypothetical protein